MGYNLKDIGSVALAPEICFCYKTSLLSFMSHALNSALVTVQISSGCRPVFSCLSDAVLLPSPHPRGKDPFSTCALPALTLSAQCLC